MKKLGKKGAFGLEVLPQVALTFLVVGIVFALTLVILSKFGDNTTVSANADADLAINNTIDAVAEIPNNWLGILAIVIAAALVASIVIVALYRQLAGGMGGGR